MFSVFNLFQRRRSQRRTTPLVRRPDHLCEPQPFFPLVVQDVPTKLRSSSIRNKQGLRIARGLRTCKFQGRAFNSLAASGRARC